jgi:8-oxo-dGTP pyrophosphatase MutT (NUDIX family)
MPRLKSNLISVYVVREASPGAATPIELLMLQRPADYAVPGDWQAVHGHIEPDEVAWRAALREQKEETGLPVLDWYRLAEIESFFNPANDVIYLVPAFVAVVPRDADTVISDEHQSSAWRTLDQAITMFSWQTQRRTVETLREATIDWPALGVALMAMDTDALHDALHRASLDPPAPTEPTAQAEPTAPTE